MGEDEPLSEPLQQCLRLCGGGAAHASRILGHPCIKTTYDDVAWLRACRGYDKCNTRPRQENDVLICDLLYSRRRSYLYALVNTTLAIIVRSEKLNARRASCSCRGEPISGVTGDRYELRVAAEALQCGVNNSRRCPSQHRWLSRRAVT